MRGCVPANRAVLEEVARSLHPDADEISHIGTGGFASTFRVRRAADLSALKIIDPSIAAVDRVDRELAALQRVNHPNVVQYRDVGSHDFDGLTYRWIEMAYVEADSLASQLRGGRAFTLGQAVELLRSAVAGAAAIWEAGTAHRDLSPNNLLITAVGQAVIVDLGLARHVDDVTITVLPTPGTPGWMSPEQVGANPTHGDWRSDQFVLGLLGYLLVTGVAPYSAPNRVDLWQAPASQTPRPVRAVNPDVPVVVADVIERMLHKQPHRRYLQPAALLADLERAAAALQVPTSSADQLPAFYLAIGHVKNFATEAFIRELRPDGLIIDAQARARTSEFTNTAAGATALAAIDPVTHFARSPVPLRPAQYQRLTHGTEAVLTGFVDEEARRRWCQPVVDAALADDPDVVIAPYFYAASGELPWIHESLACGRAVTEYLATNPGEGGKRSRTWTGVAVASSWLATDGDRDQLLTALTGQPMQALYLLVAAPQPSFGPLADVPTLRGFRDLLGVMREAGVPVIAGRRASSGLLLLALGAAGWSTGVSGNLMNMSPHPEAEETGGRGYDRVYVPQLLNHISAPIFALMHQTDPARVQLNTTYGQALLAANPALDELTTAQRMLLLQHNLTAMRSQVNELATRSAPGRVALLREWMPAAQEAYAALPATRLPGEGAGFLQAWTDVLQTG